MAQVVLARVSGVEGFERYVVVKRIHRERVADDNAIKMFTDEARLAASLHHANIVQVHDIGEEKGEYYFAMEYVHGDDLRTMLNRLAAKSATLPFEHILTITIAAASALHYAHEHCGPDRKQLNIVHRDVSPSNILVGFDGQVKVVDFGIAKATMNANESQSGTLKGKIAYMSPEQCNGKAVDRRSDVFSLGIVLWELCTVMPLFKGASDFLTMTSIVQGFAPKPSVHRPDLPPELERITMKALATDASQRYQTADEMRRELEAFATSQGLSTSASALGDYMVQQFGRRPEPWLIEGDGGLSRYDEPEIEVARARGDAAIAPVTSPAPAAPAPPATSVPPAAHASVAPSVPFASHVPVAPPVPVAMVPPAAVPAAGRSRLLIGLAVLGVLGIAAIAIMMAVGRKTAAPTTPVYVVNETEPGGSAPSTDAAPALATGAVDAGVPGDAAVKPSQVKRPPPASVAQRLTQVFGRQKERVAACFREHAIEITGAPEVSIRIEVGIDGRATAAELSPESVGATPLGRCLVAVAHATQWDRQAEPVMFRIPIKLKQK